jgi:hypothetical protein
MRRLLQNRPDHRSGLPAANVPEHDRIPHQFAGGLLGDSDADFADKHGMSISPSTNSVAQVSVDKPVSILVARKAMDAAKMQGDAAIALLEQAAEIARNPPVVDGNGHVNVRA